MTLQIVIIPPSVTLTRKHDKNGMFAKAEEIGYTTVIAGTSTFVQTRTASIVSRSMLSTDRDGRVSTVLERVTLPVVTVSATALESVVQPIFETVTIDGEVIIEATITRLVPGAEAAVVTHTQLGGESRVIKVRKSAWTDPKKRVPRTRGHCYTCTNSVQ